MSDTSSREADSIRMPPPARGAWRRRAAQNPGTILFETSSHQHEGGHSYLFEQPLELIRVRSLADLPAAFERVECALEQGFYVAGWLAYECGRHFQGLASAHTGEEGELARLGVYGPPQVFEYESEEPGPAEHLRLCPEIEIEHRDYVTKIEQIKDWIAAGDTYQVNFTTRIGSSFDGDVGELYAAFAAGQPSGYSALLHLDEETKILSFSPELFFRIDGDKITARPMKGTAPRGPEMVEWLRNDAKNRAEHVMIVDLLRNDLGRICEMGSVLVEQLFAVETYETLLQMTSTITGTLRTGLRFYEIFRALFPCGSVTGAPKIRTMQIIEALEAHPRGVYTGAIGFIRPDRSAVFSVPIRTAVVTRGVLSMGVGSGIVADSDAYAEYAECLLKARFLRRAAADFCLVETLRWENGFPLLPLHMDRLERSAERLGFAFDRKAAEAALHAEVRDETGPLRLRLLLDRDGLLHIERSEAAEWSTALRVKLSGAHLKQTESFLRYKTTVRPRFYSEELAAACAGGFDEVIFTNERGEVTEGAISSVFVRCGEQLLTPPLESGVLPGVLRRSLLERGEAREQLLSPDDLRMADAVYVGNAVRGLGRVRSLVFADGVERVFV